MFWYAEERFRRNFWSETVLRAYRGRRGAGGQGGGGGYGGCWGHGRGGSGGGGAAGRRRESAGRPTAGGAASREPRLDAAEKSKEHDLAALCEQLKVALAGVQVKAVDSSGMADELGNRGGSVV